MLLPLNTVKAHLRVDHDFENDLISAYCEAACDVVANYLNRDLYADYGSVGSDGQSEGEPLTNVPPAVQAAILLLTGYLFVKREEEHFSAPEMVLPSTVRFLLAPYRRFAAAESEGSSGT